MYLSRSDLVLEVSSPRFRLRSRNSAFESNSDTHQTVVIAVLAAFSTNLLCCRSTAALHATTLLGQPIMQEVYAPSGNYSSQRQVQP